MTITVRKLRHGTLVRLTGAHARALNGLLANLLEVAERPAEAPNRVPERSKPNAGTLGAADASNDSQAA